MQTVVVLLKLAAWPTSTEPAPSLTLNMTVSPAPITFTNTLGASVSTTNLWNSSTRFRQPLSLALIVILCVPFVNPHAVLLDVANELFLFDSTFLGPDAVVNLSNLLHPSSLFKTPSTLILIS